MNITLNNNSKAPIRVLIEEREIFIAEDGVAQVQTASNCFTMLCEYLIDFEQLSLETPVSDESFMDKVISKAANKFVSALDKVHLKANVLYEVSVKDNAVIDLSGELNAVEPSKLAEWVFDIDPAIYSFIRAESGVAKLNVLEVQGIEKERFLKFYRKMYLLSETLLFPIQYDSLKRKISRRSLTRNLQRLYALPFAERDAFFIENNGSF